MATPLLLAAVLVLLALVLRGRSHGGPAGFEGRLDSLEKAQERVERALREEAVRSREESGKAAREQRQELAAAFSTFGDTVEQRLSAVALLQKTQLDRTPRSSRISRRPAGSGSTPCAPSRPPAQQLREEVVATLGGLPRRWPGRSVSWPARSNRS